VKAGIAVDDWKLPVFRQRLTEAGYTYEDAGEAMPGITMLTVVTNDLLKLKRVLQDCQSECARTGPPKGGNHDRRPH
jgi:hypothetical protein